MKAKKHYSAVKYSTYGSDSHFIKQYGDARNKGGSWILSLFLYNNRFLFTGCKDGTVNMIDIVEDIDMKKFAHVGSSVHNSWVLSVHVSDKFLFTGCKDGKARMFNINSKKIMNEWEGAGVSSYLPDKEWEHNKPVSSVYVLDKHLFTGCDDKNARMFDINTGELIKTFSHDGKVTSVHALGKYLFTGSDDKNARMFNIKTGELMKSFAHNNKVTSVFARG